MKTRIIPWLAALAMSSTLLVPSVRADDPPPTSGTNWTPELEAQVHQMLVDEYAKIEAERSHRPFHFRRPASAQQSTPVTVVPPVTEPETYPPTVWTPELTAQVRVMMDQAYADLEAQKSHHKGARRFTTNP